MQDAVLAEGWATAHLHFRTCREAAIASGCLKTFVTAYYTVLEILAIPAFVTRLARLIHTSVAVL